jgi:hypothetical protein
MAIVKNIHQFESAAVRTQAALAAPLELPYATSSDGKMSSLVMISFIDFASAGRKTRDSKQQPHLPQRQR